MRRRTILAAGIAVLAAAAVFAAVGFGGGTTAAQALGGGAAIAPANTAAFVAVDTNLDSAQWQALDGLLAKLPGSGALIDKLRQGLEQKTGLSWADDVRPALGPELDVAVLPTASGGKPDAVALTQPADPTKLAALLQKLAGAGGPALVTREVGGWTAIGDSTAALDALTGATSHLADDSSYRDASGRLEQDALVDAYANGAQARQLASALGGSAGGASGKLVWAAGDAVAASGGLELDGFVRSDGDAPQAYRPSLLDRIPAGTLAVVDFQAQPDTVTAATGGSPLGAALAKVAGTLGGETALYVGPGAPLPSVTLVTHPADPDLVLGALHDALSSLGSWSGSGAGGLGLGSILGGLRLSHAQFGSALVVSTSQQAVDAFTGSGPKLSGDATFQQAQHESGMPDETTGLAYVDLKDALPAVQAIASMAGGGAGAGSSPDLSALRTLTVFGSAPSGGVERFTAFLEVG
jgi:hypothetical protein